MENNYLVSEWILVRLLNSLKMLDVRGYDSMSTLVATVMAVESVLEDGPYKSSDNEIEKTEKAEE